MNWKSMLAIVIAIGGLLGALFYYHSKAVLPTSDEGMIVSSMDCVSVDIDDLYDDPVSHNGVIVCTTGFARFQYDWMMLVPEGFPSSELRVKRIELGLHQSQSQLRDIQTDDEVFVRGTFWVDEECLYAFESLGTNEDGQPYLCQNVNVPMGLDIELVELRTRYDIDEQCRVVSINVLQRSPHDYDGKILCTEARVLFHGTDPFLLNPTTEVPASRESRSIALTPTHPIARTGDLQDQDVIHVMGRFSVPASCYRVLTESDRGNSGNIEFYCQGNNEPAMFDALEIEVTNRAAQHENCLQVPIENLYSDPLAFNLRIVCTSGIAVVQDLHSPHPIIAIASEDTGPLDLNDLVLMLELSREAVVHRSLSNGDLIQVRGRIGVSQACYQGEMGLRPDEEEMMCFPIPIPFWISNPEIEILQ